MIRLRNVAPVRATDYRSNHRLGHTKHLGDLHVGDPAGQVFVSDLHHVGFSQLGATMLRSKKWTPSRLAHHVGVVLGICAQPEMIWSNAFAVVAGVAHMESGWNWATEEHPRDAIRFSRSPVDSESPVPLLVDVCRPFPAGVGFSDVAHEPFSNVCSWPSKVLKKAWATALRAFPNFFAAAAFDHRGEFYHRSPQIPTLVERLNNLRNRYGELTISIQGGRDWQK